jgi:hypothetical protein
VRLRPCLGAALTAPDFQLRSPRTLDTRHAERVLAEGAIVVGATALVIGAFSWRLAEPDDRFDEYSARMRRTQRRAGPWLFVGGLLLATIGILGMVM